MGTFKKIETSLFFLVLWLSAAAAASPQSVGVLVVAHGGSKRWDAAVRNTVQQAGLAGPHGVAFGMGMHDQEVHALQGAVARLEAQGVTRLIVVPLLVSSHSEVYRQYEYLFGLRHDAEWPEAGPPLEYHVPVTMTKALDDDPAVSDILLERARAMSRNPHKETVILIAHGPNEDADNARWLASLQGAAEHLKQSGGFFRALPFTIRDDAEDAVREQAREALREAVQRESRERRVLVVPVLIAQGGIEQKIPQLLDGLAYRFDGKTLLPHPKIAQWISKQALELAAAK